VRVARLPQLREAAPALTRAVRWQPVPAAVVVAALVLWWRSDRPPTAGDAVWMPRMVALLLAVALSFALDDRTRTTLGGVPAPPWWRAAVRLVVAGVPALVAWVVALVWVDHRVDVGVPVAGLCLEAATLAAVAVAASAALARWRDIPEPGAVVAPAVLVSSLVLLQLPPRFALAVSPGPEWAAAHRRWAVLLAVAVVVVTAALRDPAARPPLRALALRRDRQGAEHPPAEVLVTDDLDVCVRGRQPPAGEQHEGRVGHP
jgi:hypothetical protein